MAEAALIAAACLAFLLGLVHSVLGERYILIRLFRRELPRLYGSDWFTRRTLRFAWHITTIAWWGFAAILIGFAVMDLDAGARFTLRVIAGVSLASAAIAALFTRARHLAWVVLLAIAILAWLGSLE